MKTNGTPRASRRSASGSADLAGEVEVEDGAVEALGLGRREPVGQPPVGTDHGGAELAQDLLDHHADQELVLDHQQALAGEAARARRCGGFGAGAAPSAAPARG